jgi:hypothetical protein
MNYFHTKTIYLNLFISSGVGIGVRQIDEGVLSSNYLSVGIHHMHKVSFCGKNLSMARGAGGNNISEMSVIIGKIR